MKCHTLQIPDRRRIALSISITSRRFRSKRLEAWSPLRRRKRWLNCARHCSFHWVSAGT